MTKLVKALDCVALGLSDSHDAWWIIGSAAVALHGGEPGIVADVDVVTSRRDLDALYERLPLTTPPEPSKPIFRSDRFGRWSEPALDVEFMAGLNLLEDGDWHPIEPQTRQAMIVGDHTLYVPEKPELIAILQRFGREKDLARAASLAG